MNGETITPINRISAGDSLNIALYGLGENQVFGSNPGTSAKYDENIIEQDIVEK